MSGSTLSVLKFPIIIRLRTNAGIIQNIPADSLFLNTEVSVNVLHRISEATLGQLWVYSANFWAKYPPRDQNISNNKKP